MTPQQVNINLFRSSQQLPCQGLGPSKGFLSRHIALQWPSTSTCALLTKLQKYKDPLRWDALGPDVPGHQNYTTDANHFARVF